MRLNYLSIPTFQRLHRKHILIQISMKLVIISQRWFEQWLGFEKTTNRYKNQWSSLLTDHYDDVIMTTIASQITSLTSVYSTVYSDADQRKHQSSASLAFVWGIHRGRWIPRTKGQLRGKCFHLMTSSCICVTRPRWVNIFWKLCVNALK